MDEFLVSGETIVRNLQLGMERAAGFGGAMEVGYLPDMFGHVGQMPQILRAAGFTDAVVWRGVPSAVDKTAFNWSAPDGSVVRAEYLLAGYSAGASVGDDAKALVRRLEAFAAEHADVPPRSRGPHLVPQWHRPPRAPALARDGSSRKRTRCKAISRSRSRRFPTRSPARREPGCRAGRASCAPARGQMS